MTHSKPSNTAAYIQSRRGRKNTVNKTQQNQMACTIPFDNFLASSSHGSGKSKEPLPFTEAYLDVRALRSIHTKFQLSPHWNVHTD
ncbi:hypothetical protein CEXT_137171 [Caerostris extrusa]|uniref:Uncharacterized protein n=1 Tax=Caerostris extrusa TaxID=172846 RepID=A0AAV4T5Q6_CAEEX|nr:hypothetical protein CEXT_137171 [Caerostris extrusa]